MSPHCSTFPVDLPMQCIKATGVERGGIVLDPFMGSGTTGKAAIMLGHQFLGFELDPVHCKQANDWIQEPTERLLLVT
jgi:DNA modification methylase